MKIQVLYGVSCGLSVKDLTLSLLWLRFNPWPRNFRVLQVRPKRENTGNCTWKKSVCKWTGAFQTVLFKGPQCLFHTLLCGQARAAVYDMRYKRSCREANRPVFFFFSPQRTRVCKHHSLKHDPRHLKPDHLEFGHRAYERKPGGSRGTLCPGQTPRIADTAASVRRTLWFFCK